MSQPRTKPESYPTPVRCRADPSPTRASDIRQETRGAVQHFPRRSRDERHLAAALAQALKSIGVSRFFGVGGGGIAPFVEAVVAEGLDAVHFRHETGAAFGAVEAYHACGEPVVVFTTFGPGIFNALNGLMAARKEGAKVALVSSMTPPSNRGRFPVQETSVQTMPADALYAKGPIFDFADTIEEVEQLAGALRGLKRGFSRPGGFVAHLAVSARLFAAPATLPDVSNVISSTPTCSQEELVSCAEMLNCGSFAVWVGMGAHRASDEIRRIVERTGAPVVCSPRGKGAFPENDPHFIGVAGVGGHPEALQFLARNTPEYLLVLGSRLGEASTFWMPELAPAKAIIHVDVDPDVFGAVYASRITYGVQSDVKLFLRQLLPLIEEVRRPGIETRSPFADLSSTPLQDGAIRPRVLMEAVQRIAVKKHDCVVLTEPGASFAWGSRVLCFTRPGRYRTPMAWGSMGQSSAGVVGAALAGERTAVAIVGDGALLMTNEISTAVTYRAPSVWVVINDGQYGMVRHCMAAQGFGPAETGISPTDFALLGRSVGADGERVLREDEIAPALERACSGGRPYVVDVVVDPAETGPYLNRAETLARQGLTANSKDKEESR